MKLRKASIALMLAIAALGTLTACTSTSDKNAADSAYVEKLENQTQQENQNNQEITLNNIKIQISQHNGSYYIDEESALQIIRIAMKDAQSFYVDMGAPNMQYDKNLKIVEGEDHFYPKWMNEYYYLARAMSESSLKVNAKNSYKNTKGETVNVEGIMQISDGSEGIKVALQNYWKNIFNKNCDLSSLVVIPTEEDLETANNLKIIEAVYNSAYLSICYDVYSAKCLNPITHVDYYANYGGFSEDIRRLATIGFYGTRHDWVLSGLRNGNLEEVLFEIKHMDIYLQNMEKYENKFRDKYEIDNEFQR